MSAIITAAVVGAGASVYSAVSNSNATNDAVSAQTDASVSQIAEYRRQFDILQTLLAPYNTAGTNAVGAQQNLLGLNGATAQTAAINSLRYGPQMSAMLDVGQNALIQNASATGGLRGGNLQRGLAELSPTILNQLINQQYANLGGLSNLGQNAAAGAGSAAMQTGQLIGNSFGQMGQAQAGGYLSQASNTNNLLGNLTGLLSNQSFISGISGLF